MADESDDWEDDLVEALPGSVSGTSGIQDFSMALLDAIGEVSKFHVTLAEMTESEWSVIQGRLGVFRDLVARLPTEPRPQRKVGFQVAAKRKKR